LDQRYLEVLKKYTNVKDINPQCKDSLKDLGIDSMGSIDLLLSLEKTFSVEVPPYYLTEETFSTVQTLWNVFESLIIENKNQYI
jgi:acyl carrier protein